MLGELCQPTGAGPELFHKFIMNASMEMSKSNRRKQSKPNRLMADERNGATPKSNIESAFSNSPIQQKTDVEPMETDNDDKDPMDLSTRASESPARAAPVDVQSTHHVQTGPTNASAELEMVNFPCHSCGEIFSSRAQQEQHISERHSSDIPKGSSGSPSTVFPTAYHQLATELNLGPLAPGVMTSSAKPAEKSKASSIFASTASSLPTLGTPGVGGKGSAGTVFQREAYCELCQREFCNKYFLKTHKANIHGIVDPSDPKAVVMAKVSQSTKVSTSPHHTHEPVQPQQRMPIHHPAPQKPTSNESMEDFCEICQKHFCNKYYLKKHKVDVHNIRPDGSKPSAVSSDSGMDVRSMPHIPSVSSAPMPSLPMMVPPLSNINSTSMNNMLFVNPFVPSMAAMSMVPPVMQPQFFMPGMSNLAAAHAATQALSNVSPPQIKNEPKVSRAPSNLERGESLPDSDIKAEGFCDICRKEFCNTYFLQIHRANKHGIFDEATASAALMMSMAGAADQKEQAEGTATKSSASPASSTASNTIRPVVLKNDKDRHQTSPAFSLQPTLTSKYDSSTVQPVMPSGLSFDAMLAAKQADRIMCDICNKEVCNKYFLKAHKLKMHGITSPGDDKRTTPTKEVKRETSNVQPPLPTLTMQQQPPLPTLQAMCSQQSQQLHQPTQTSQAQKTSADPTNFDSNHLIKLGIDPEAYCFLCKKEFCSKYFLKTHKLNMHGVKADSDLAHRVTPRGTITPPTSVSPVSVTSPAHSLPIAPNAETFQWKWKENRSKGKRNTFSPVSEQGAATGNSDQFTWRWKEPANATRVFCDICNKELCNKYFLRTHKLKKHGICDSADQGMQASNMMVDLARVSQASLQSKPTLSPKGGVNGFGNRCPSPTNQSQSSSPTEMDQLAAMRDDVCQVCGMVFADGLAVDEHIRAEHGVEIFETPKSMASGEAKSLEVYECTQCSYKTPVWQKMANHEARKHNPDMNTCSSCHITFSHVQMLIKHLRDIHNKNVTSASLQVASQQRNGNSINSRKMASRPLHNFRNASRAKFSGNSSIGGRLSHRTDRTSKVSLSHTRVYACDRCSYTCGTIRNLRFHQAMKHKSKTTLEVISNQSNGTSGAATSTMMQEFDINSMAGTDSIAKATVMLPVYQRINEDVRVNITLTPSKTTTLVGAH